MRRLIIAAGAAVLLMAPATAHASPQLDPVTTQSDVGPGNPDYFCTYQVAFDDVICVPGDRRPTQRFIVPSLLDKILNWFS